MSAVQTTYALRNGLKIPALGFGTWQSKPGEVGDAVRKAIQVGFRHIDCAAVYGNEAEIGAALKELMTAHVVRREELFITSKLWNTEHRPLDVRAACMDTIRNLQVGYLDLYLIHWPCAMRKGMGPMPRNNTGGCHMDSVAILETWGAMESLVDDGLVKSIGVSNFTIEQLRDVDTHARIKPAVNQVEVHPALPQKELRAAAKALGIMTEAYCPMAVGFSGHSKGLHTHPEIIAMARKANCTPAQLLLRWNIQSGNIVLSKSVTAQRIAENGAIPFGELSAETMKALDDFGAKYHLRVCNPDFFLRERTTAIFQ